MPQSLRRSRSGTTRFRYLSNGLDLDWADTNVGAFFLDNDFNAAIVLNGDNGQVYGASSEDPGAPTPAQFVASASDLVAKVRAAEEARGPAADILARQQSISEAVDASATALFGDRLFLLTAALVQPDFGTALPDTNRSAIIITAKQLGDEFVSEVSTRFVLNGSHLPCQKIRRRSIDRFPRCPGRGGARKPGGRRGKHTRGL